MAPLVAAALDTDKPFDDYVVDSWDVKQGLPQISVLAVTQDADGYLWFGTQAGLARFDGTEGYDAQASATAYGNEVTGYACADCQGRIDINNGQVNNTDVGAQSVVNVQSGRSVRGVASAVGNSATYYVSRPSGQ